MANAKGSRRNIWSPRVFLIGSVIAWLIMIAPITMLLSWLSPGSSSNWLPISMLLGPFAFIGLWLAIQSTEPLHRWPVMQYFGWGAVLLPLTIIGMLVSIWIPPGTVGIAVLSAWLVLGVLGTFAATNISERVLTFGHALLDRPYKLVQLSDVHVGSRSATFLNKAIDQALSHQPDALLLTGDLIDASAVSGEDLRALGKAPCPIYFAIGNHERYIDLDAAIAMVEAHGVHLLRSDAMTHGQLQFVGIDDADSPDHVSNHLPTITLSDEHYRILLYHRPDGWPSARKAGIDLMLSGHTHGGQIWPFNYLVKWRFKHMVGLFTEENRHLYVSPGTGCWGPIMRLGTRSEMTVINLVPTPAPETTMS